MKAFDTINDNFVPLVYKNDYKMFIFPKIKAHYISARNLLSLRTKKWERIKTRSISLNEKFVMAYVA